MDFWITVSPNRKGFKTWPQGLIRIVVVMMTLAISLVEVQYGSRTHTRGPCLP